MMISYAHKKFYMQTILSQISRHDKLSRIIPTMGVPPKIIPRMGY